MFHGDDTMTDEFLQEQLFESNPKDFAPLCAKIVPALAHIATEDLDMTKAEAYLAEQVAAGLSDVAGAAISKYWKKDRSKVHEQMIQKASWNNKLNSMAWRLDVLTKSRHIEELNNPAAIVELKVDKQFPTHTEVVRFEMDAKKLDEVVAQIEQIESKLSSIVA